MGTLTFYCGQEIISGNYQWKLSVKTMSENYQLVYYHAKNVRFNGILAYPKRICQNSKSKCLKKQGQSCP